MICYAHVEVLTAVALAEPSPLAPAGNQEPSPLAPAADVIDSNLESTERGAVECATVPAHHHCNE